MSLLSKEELKELISGCVKGERKAQQQVYEMFYGKMMGVCLRYTKDADVAKDVLQDGFIKVYSKIKNYNGEGSFEGWVRRIIVNTAIDFFRKNKSSATTLGSEYVDEAGEMIEEEENEESIFSSIKTSDVLEEIQRLSPAYQMVFNLYVVEGFSHKEIAEKVDISVGTSKSNLAKAKMNLKKALSKKLVQQ